MSSSLNDVKLPLPKFIKLLTSNNVPVPKAMAITGKIYKEFSTPSLLATLTDLKLKVAGIDDKEDRKMTLAAMKKSGYLPIDPVRKKLASEASTESSTAGPSTPQAPITTVEKITTPTKRKRKRVEEENEFLPNGPVDEAADIGSLEFNEILDEEAIKTKSTTINRAPLMTAWATMVAERMGFQREEALSIASVYTEMNAMSKGVSLGIYKTQDQQKRLDAVKGGSQPYVELMGRRPLLYLSETNQWRALTDSSPTKPSVAFSYISRSFRQTTPYIIGALRLLAESYSSQEINNKAWALYCDFRPLREGWGERSEVRCDKILGLRNVSNDNAGSAASKQTPGDLIHYEAATGENSVEDYGVKSKKPKEMTLEEYEAALDEDHTFDDVDLDI